MGNFVLIDHERSARVRGSMVTDHSWSLIVIVKSGCPFCDRLLANLRSASLSVDVPYLTVEKGEVEIMEKVKSTIADPLVVTYPTYLLVGYKKILVFKDSNLYQDMIDAIENPGPRN